MAGQHGFKLVGSALVWIWSMSGLGVRWFARALAGRLSPPEQALVLAGHDGWRASFETADSFPTIALVHGPPGGVDDARRAAAARGTPLLEVRVAHDLDGYLDVPAPAGPVLAVHPEWEPPDRAVTRTLLALADLGVVAPGRGEGEP